MDNDDNQEGFTMSALQLPYTLFKTQKWMDDYGAADMRYGDLTETQLKSKFHLIDVSSRVDPYRLTKITPFNQPQSMFHGSRGEGEKITSHECATILFDELRHLSTAFSLYGQYKYLIEDMINHMQYGNGLPFYSMYLNTALKEQILNDYSKNSTLSILKSALEKNIDWNKGCYSAEESFRLKEAISQGKLPKFDRLQDNFNGMGITVHDTWATYITIKSLHINNDYYHAIVHYKVQDHFGLDDEDILDVKFSQFRFFRIWFILQRYKLFAFKPFMTNMETTIKIQGKRHEK
jgi:uncharacterized protein (TIGR03034 family)